MIITMNTGRCISISFHIPFSAFPPVFFSFIAKFFAPFPTFCAAPVNLFFCSSSFPFISSFGFSAIFSHLAYTWFFYLLFFLNVKCICCICSACCVCCILCVSWLFCCCACSCWCVCSSFICCAWCVWCCSFRA